MPDLNLRKNPSFLTDLAQFLLQNKKWWLTPIAVVVVLLGVLLVLGGSSIAPFIYSLF
jgi:hypothetical protein